MPCQLGIPSQLAWGIHSSQQPTWQSHNKREAPTRCERHGPDAPPHKLSGALPCRHGPPRQRQPVRRILESHVSRCMPLNCCQPAGAATGWPLLRSLTASQRTLRSKHAAPHRHRRLSTLRGNPALTLPARRGPPSHHLQHRESISRCVFRQKQVSSLGPFPLPPAHASAYQLAGVRKPWLHCRQASLCSLLTSIARPTCEAVGQQRLHRCTRGRGLGPQRGAHVARLPAQPCCRGWKAQCDERMSQV